MRVCFYTFRSPLTLYVARLLAASGKLSAVILQTSMSFTDKARFLARRVRRYGLLKAADEVLFSVYYQLFLKRADERLRRAYFPREAFEPITACDTPIYEVDSLNSNAGRALLGRLQPDLVIMESRERIDRDVLAIPSVGFIGCHPGIIPEYRGVHAAFWAMCCGEPDKVGLSIYVADDGLDTGGILAQRPTGPKFPLRHFKVESERLMVEGVIDLLTVVELAERSALAPYHKPASSSRAFSHVGLSDYLKAAWRLARA